MSPEERSRWLAGARFEEMETVMLFLDSAMWNDWGAWELEFDRQPTDIDIDLPPRPDQY